jgi:hypothetical protein
MEKGRKDGRFELERRTPAGHPALFEERRAQWLRVRGQPFARRSIVIQLGTFAILLAVWQLPVANPVKLLVVLFHEMSHVIAAWLTGGVVFGIAVDPGGAGITLGMGGAPLLIVSAGYIGSLAIGALLYYLSAKWNITQVWLVLLFLSCLSLVMGWLNDFTAVFGYGAIVLIVIGIAALGEGAKKFVVRMVATACCLYAVIDVVGELLHATPSGFEVRGRMIGSDIGELSSLLGIGEAWIALAWIGIGMAVLPWLITMSAWTDANTQVKLRFRRPKKWKPRHQLYDPNNPDTIPEYTIR